MRRLIPVILLLAACSREPATRNQQPPSADRAPHDKPGEAAKYYEAKRTGTTDPHAAYDAARARMGEMEHYSTVDNRRIDRASAAKPIGNWTFLGPGNIGGRTRVLVVDPNAPHVMYAAAVSGGVFKTVNGGARWEATGDSLANLTVNSLAMHPTDRNVLYAGTGEGYFREEVRGTGLPLRGNGVYITRNGGASWEHLRATDTEDFQWVNDLVISTKDPNRIYAATRSGVWRSNDAGATWSRAHSSTVRGGCLDLAWRDDTDGDYLFVSCGTFERANVYRNRNAQDGGAWESVLSESQMGRTTLAIAPSNPSVIYALAATNQSGVQKYQGMLAVFRSESNGDAGTWTAQVRNDSTDKLATLLLTNPWGASRSDCAQQPDQWITMGWYCNTIAVDPRDPNRVWVGGVDLFRSDDGGRTWGVGSYWWIRDDAPAFVHADQHAIVFHPQYDGQSNKTMFVTNDGGVFRTDDARAAVGKGIMAVCNGNASSMRWTNLNHNYGATQFYHGAAFPDGKRYFGGAQDNGTIVGDVNQGPDLWGRVVGGDGGYVAIDQVDPNIVYASLQGGVLFKSFDGGRTFRSMTGMPGDNYLFITPYVLDPNEHNRLWIGGRTMWRTDDAGNFWTAAGKAFIGQVSAIAVAPGRADRVLAGTNNGAIYRTDSATTANPETQWTNAIPRSGFVSSLNFAPGNADVVYATYAGFGGTHVWKSTDGGATWSALDGNLPDIPVHSLAVDPTLPTRIYLGTDLGMFVSTDGGATWLIENTGFAAVVTEVVFIGPGAFGPAVYAFTHGRGAWRAELQAPMRRRSF